MKEPVIIHVTVAEMPARADKVFYLKNGVIREAYGDITKGITIPAGSTYIGWDVEKMPTVTMRAATVQ